MKNHRLFTKASVAAAVACSLCAATATHARVTRFVVTSTEPYAGGAMMGGVGAFERLVGTATIEVHPLDPHNAGIVNLDKAPRNARGLVEFTSPVWIIKPVNMSAGNRKIWYAINNRGNSELLQRANAAAIPTLTAKRLELGFTLVDAGWHGDGIKPDPLRLFPDFPVARNPDGSSIVGPLRLEMLPTADVFSRPLITGWVPYQAANTNTLSASLTVRDRQDAPRVTIPSSAWAFGTCPTGPASLTPTTTDVCIFDGFKADKMYEIVYLAKDPIVMGLAHAVTRDVGSFLRFETQDDFGNPNPLAQSTSQTGIVRAYSSGVSSTGMYQREFLYLGFNEDERRRKVFDGVTIYTAGSHRLFANVQFAHPTFYSRQDANQDYTSNSWPPFTFGVSIDPITGITDGLLKRPASDPVVMQIDGGLEAWQWKMSLNVTDGMGRPVRTPENVRLYYLNGASHVQTGQGLLVDGLNAGAPGVCQFGTQRGAAVNHTFRALVVAMDQWVDRGIRPPASNYPRLENGTLVPLADYRGSFPMVAGVMPPVVTGTLNVLNFGPNFGAEGGLQQVLPPARGAGYQVFVPRADIDGNDVEGVKQMEVRVPLGTNTGWNVRVNPRAPDLCGLTGGYFPFAVTQAQRIAAGDPRRSLQERYGSQNGLIKTTDNAVDLLVKQRFMLPEDAQLYRDRVRSVVLIP